jgi:hypothetical protein
MKLNFLTPPSVPKKLPSDLELEIQKLKQYQTKDDVLKATYDLLTKKYRGHRLKTLIRFFDLFKVDVNSLWSKNGFLHCTNMNYLMKILLIGSLKFKEEDIKFRWTLIHFYSPHEYVQVRTDDNKWINIDLWGKAYDIKFGSYAHGLHSGSLIS